MRLLFERAKIVAEPSGACAFAALLAGKVDVAGLRVGVTITGGNVTAARFAELVADRRGARARPRLRGAARGLERARRRRRRHHATTAVALVFGALVFAIPAALTWRIEAEAWPYIVASAALELVYFALLAAVYSRADYSFAYPDRARLGAGDRAARSRWSRSASRSGSPPRSACSRSRPASCSSAASAAPRRTRSRSLLALAVGACIAGYTLSRRPRRPPRRRDAVLRGRARPVRDAVRGRGRGRPRDRRAARGHRPARAPPPASAMVAAYVLVLAALERAEAAPVAALRETSVVMAAAGAAIAGRESVPPAGSPAPCSSSPAWPRSL